MEELNRPTVEEQRHNEKNKIIVILDEVRSMHNVGSIFRTCDAFAVEALYLCGYTPQPPHRDIHKTALGATETVKWLHFATTAEAITAAKSAGYSIWAAEQTHNSKNVADAGRIEGPIALIMGNEVTGVSDEALAIADGRLEIPQFGSKHSLNVAVSAGIVIWEAVRKLAIASSAT